MDNTLTTIRLSGELGKKFGKVHKFAVHSVAEAIRFMSAVIPGFQSELMNSQDRGVAYAVFVGKKNVDKEQIHNSSNGKVIKFTPVIQGSKNGGIFQIIVGIVLIAAAVIAPFVGAGGASPYLYSMGASMVLGGVIQLLSPQQNISSKNNPANGTSYNFSGPVNTTAQGNPVPLLYGEMVVGSAVISAGIYSQDQQ